MYDRFVEVIKVVDLTNVPVHMKEILDYAGTVMDIRQEKKVLHKIADIILLVFFATLANADDWVEIEMFGKEHEDFLQNYLELA